jgi:hypothetical protein
MHSFDLSKLLLLLIHNQIQKDQKSQSNILVAINEPLLFLQWDDVDTGLFGGRLLHIYCNVIFKPIVECVMSPTS